jgi:hypothetical protein
MTYFSSTKQMKQKKHIHYIVQEYQTRIEV